MAKKFLTSIDLTKNQILNVALQNLATAPANPVSGQIYFNTTDGLVFYWRVTDDPSPGDGQWVNITGSITEVIAGSGLTGGGNSGSITLNVNVDDTTIEIVGDIVRIKDGGVSNAKLGTDSVTTVKITDSNITFAKIQDVATMTVIGRVAAGSGVSSSIGIVTDLANASTTTLVTSQAIKSYVDDTVAGIGNLQGSWDASGGTFPAASPTVAGDYWYVSVAGTVNTVPFNIGDVIIARVNAASTTLASDWIQLEVNRDQATTSILGLVRLATEAEVITGADTEKAVTPSAIPNATTTARGFTTLATDAETQAGTVSTKTVTPESLSSRTATETRTGIAEIATQAETDTGTDDARIVTPLKLKTYFDSVVGGHTADVGNNTNVSFVVTHNLNTRSVIVALYDNSTQEEVITDVETTTVNTITVAFAVAPTTNQYRVVIKK